MYHALQSVGLQKVDLFEAGDEIRTEDVGSALNHVENCILNGHHGWMHAPHIELVCLVEDVLEI